MSTKINWPFKSLEVGESCIVEVDLAKKAKQYVHVYANQTGKRMSWKSNWDGTVTVTRMPNVGTDSYELTLEQLDILKSIFEGPDGLKRFAKIASGAHRVVSTESGTVVFEARNTSVTL